MNNQKYERSRAVLGEESLEILRHSRIAVVGVGGVGGWCAEALARTGIESITIVDDDVVAESNLNRQDAAICDTIGMPKVLAMKRRLEAVNPECRVTDINARYPNAAISPGNFDLVVDAIDSVDCKAQLLTDAANAGVKIISSMGAALRLDPTKVTTSSFRKVTGDGLARALRHRLRAIGNDRMDFPAVWSTEQPADLPIRGSLMQVTCTFGMCLAAEAIRLLCRK